MKKHGHASKYYYKNTAWIAEKRNSRRTWNCWRLVVQDGQDMASIVKLCKVLRLCRKEDDEGKYQYIVSYGLKYFS